MNFLNLLLTIVTLNEHVLAVDLKKLYYEKNLSEYCKRRVIPSIFLGRNVVETSAFILNFSKLDLPYHCYISVRTESGSNIIMVLNIKPESSPTSHYEPCADNSPQFLVYEMGETFGGYWGPLPEVMLKHKPIETSFYTLKTTQATTMSTEPPTEESVETTTPTPTPGEGPRESQEFIQLELPIVNVSGNIEPGVGLPTKGFDFEEAFDYLYDVTPIPGEKYETSILPLVQLSVRKQTDDGRREYGQEPRYDLDVLEGFTPDSRLTLPHFTPASHNQKHRTIVNKRLSYGRNRATKRSFSKKLPSSRVTKNNKLSKYLFPTTMALERKYKVNEAPDSWEIIDKLIKKLNNSMEHDTHDENDKKNTSKISENIANMKHNFSIYLAPNLSIYNDVKSSNLLSLTTKQTIAPTVNPFRRLIYENKKTTLPTSKKIEETKNIYPHSLNKTEITEHKTTPVTLTFAEKRTSTKTTGNSTNEQKFSIQMDSQTNNKVESNKASTDILNGTIPPVSLVDHESWENIVQAAPNMAVLLNKVPQNAVNKSDWSSLNETYRKELLERKKRAIHLIAIENGRPRNLTTGASTVTTTKGSFNIMDMQQFASMVELQDDDMHGRVALRYLKQYVGPSIYNNCVEGQFYSKDIILLNSSRIVLALNNFTFSRMSVILTSARTLLSGEMQCSTSQLECQVSGARVCVDSLAACDGVPNCGSYDIYDEDRLMCGVTKGLQHNVYIAAFTLLALVLTLCYAIHYWLKRCVPKVADAFFVYKDGIENILYLETIMRSPGDYDDDGAKMFYPGNIFAGPDEELMHNSKKSRCLRLFRKCFSCFKKRKGHDESEQEIFTLGQKKTYSFTQMELSRMLGKSTVDTAAQTGDSLEMSVFKEESDYQVPSHLKPKVEVKDPPIMIHDSLITLEEPLPEDELNLMKFFRDSRSASSESIIIKQRREKVKLDFKTGAAPGGEKEISSVMYDEEIKAKPGPSGVKPKMFKAKSSSQTRKRIRFNETTTTIPSLSDDGDNDGEEEKLSGISSVFGQSRTFQSQPLSTIKENDESGIRHRHFWESKRKNNNKKTKVSLR